jgi:hypothetical protein
MSLPSLLLFFQEIIAFKIPSLEVEKHPEKLFTHWWGRGPGSVRKGQGLHSCQEYASSAWKRPLAEGRPMARRSSLRLYRHGLLGRSERVLRAGCPPFDPQGPGQQSLLAAAALQAAASASGAPGECTRPAAAPTDAVPWRPPTDGGPTALPAYVRAYASPSHYFTPLSAECRTSWCL